MPCGKILVTLEIRAGELGSLLFEIDTMLKSTGVSSSDTKLPIDIISGCLDE